MIRVMNEIIRDIAANNIHPKDKYLQYHRHGSMQCYAIRHREEAASMGATASIARERLRAAGAGPSPTNADAPLPVPTTKTSPVKIGCNNTLTKPKRSGSSLPARSSSPTHDVPNATEFVTPKQGAEWAWCKSCKKQFRIRRRQHESSRGHTGQRQAVLTRATPLREFDFASQCRIYRPQCAMAFRYFFGLPPTRQAVHAG